MFGTNGADEEDFDGEEKGEEKEEDDGDAEGADDKEEEGYSKVKSRVVDNDLSFLQSKPQRWERVDEVELWWHWVTWGSLSGCMD